MGSSNFEATSTEGVWIGEAGQGPTVAILGGVHGDEPTGFEVVRRSVEELGFDCGTVILALGNLEAEGKGRAVTPGSNLNRQFKQLTDEEKTMDPTDLSYEVRRAQALLPYLDMADAALDLHDFTNECDPFIICERNALDTALKIGAPLVSFGWSKTEPGGSDGYMFVNGKEGLCYELGQKKYPQKSLNRGHGAVSRFLIAKGLVDADLPPMFDNPTLVETSRAVIREVERYELARDFINFELLRPGELIARMGEEEIRAEKGQVIIFPMADASIGEEAFTLGQRVTE